MAQPRVKPLRDQPDPALREVYDKVSARQTYPAWKEGLLWGDLQKWRKDDVGAVLRALRDLYRGELQVQLNGTKADLVARVKALRTGGAGTQSSVSFGPPAKPPQATPSPAAPPNASPQRDGDGLDGSRPQRDVDGLDGSRPQRDGPDASRSEDLPEDSDDVVEVFLSRYAPRAEAEPAATGQPAAPPTPTKDAREGEDLTAVWRRLPSPEAPRKLSAALRRDPLLGGTSEPAFTPLRWPEARGIAVVDGTGTYTVIVDLLEEEHRMIAGRKRQAAVHLVCLSTRLRPCQWPVEFSVWCQGSLTQPPPWRPKNPELSWYRTVSHIDLSSAVLSHVSPRRFPVVIEITKNTQRCALVCCVVQNVGQLAVEGAVLGRPPVASPLWQLDDEANGCAVEKQLVSLRDPLTLVRISQPAKGANCKHPAAFDLKTYIQYSSRNHYWNCPICDEEAPPQLLGIDPLMQKILTEVTDPEVSQVEMRSDGTWEPRRDPDPQGSDDESEPQKPVVRESVKREPGTSTQAPTTLPPTKRRRTAPSQQVSANFVGTAVNPIELD
eukprot:TRINITY_DN1616_c0_g1_i1.p1 TRINITY_DN1616_c0_g1~~TRINITY_DN1616_c0_g1_i1.p1  ORF type:complete len:552 (+),score=112.36 TRINITY_DN1616_c0_g1_i1:73-1728(+)